MTDDKKIYIPSSPLRKARSSIMTTFEPGARTLKASFQTEPQFEPPTVYIVIEKDVAVTLRDEVVGKKEIVVS
jgi:uncharacterized protein